MTASNASQAAHSKAEGFPLPCRKKGEEEIDPEQARKDLERLEMTRKKRWASITCYAMPCRHFHFLRSPATAGHVLYGEDFHLCTVAVHSCMHCDLASACGNSNPATQWQ